jgi:PPE-repeat protein
VAVAGVAVMTDCSPTGVTATAETVTAPLPVVDDCMTTGCGTGVTATVVSVLDSGVSATIPIAAGMICEAVTATVTGVRLNVTRPGTGLTATAPITTSISGSERSRSGATSCGSTGSALVVIVAGERVTLTNPGTGVTATADSVTGIGGSVAPPIATG